MRVIEQAKVSDAMHIKMGIDYQHLIKCMVHFNISEDPEFEDY